MFRHREPPVQRHQHGAEPRAGIEQHQIVRPVQAEDRDAVAFDDTEFCPQCARRPFDAGIERGVAERLALKHDRRLVRRECRVPCDEIGKVHVQLSVFGTGGVSRTRCGVLTPLRRAGIHARRDNVWTPDQQRTTPQGRRVAQHPGHAQHHSSLSPVSYSASRPMRSRQSSAVHGSISEPQRLSR